jgi:hypothetical protein
MYRGIPNGELPRLSNSDENSLAYCDEKVTQSQRRKHYYQLMITILIIDNR